MDDIRRPQRLERRDYALPAGRPGAPGPAPTDLRQVAPRPAVDHHHSQAPPAIHHPADHYQAQAHHHAPMARRRRHLPHVHPVVLILLPVAAAALFAAGYMFKSSGSAKSLPATVTNQADFTVYFPSPMPPGYTYTQNTATFQIGEIFYKFSDGAKRITVKEEPMPQTRPNLSLLAGYNRFRAPIGQAAIGSSFGQPVAVVVAGSTVITMNTSGQVSPQDLQTAINNLKNIGRSNQKT